MSEHPRPATAEETERLWPAVRAARLMDTYEEFSAYRDAGPWRVRVTDRGDAALLGRWRAHLDVLAIRGLWGSERAVAAFVADAAGLARAQGLARVMSPLLPLWALAPYAEAGMEPLETIVAIQSTPRQVRGALPPEGVELRRGSADDLDALVELDAGCFDGFWRYGRPEFLDLTAAERLVVAEKPGAAGLLGYTLATVSRGAATLSRLAVAPGARCRGLGGALLADAAAWADRSGAATLSLCTQESNSASRSLYARAGLHEVEERYGFAACHVRTGEIRS